MKPTTEYCAAPKTKADFAAFERRAQAGELLNVVFFGASLTWRANPSDPLLTSYRANVERRMEAAYPQAYFRFWDAVIGGTGSQLGVLRLATCKANPPPCCIASSAKPKNRAPSFPASFKAGRWTG